MTTDGASVMVKVGKLVSCYQQLCFAHGIQLAVVDILYKKRVEGDIELTKKSLTILDIDDDENVAEINDVEGLTITIDRQPADVIRV
ncbi:unnamed protein product [Arctia plantaginis]|uniref:Uncharacterized protein n=1 Tax=Arctia plantaginis TaxID=874455 RepID=A0A8S0YYG3_ARCPL|nr:unnamed protein product [Arctia plantaginis]